jgi:hypothetical protein
MKKRDEKPKVTTLKEIGSDNIDRNDLDHDQIQWR